MFRKLKEECGIFGIYSKEKEENVAYYTCIGLSSLQHRGEESCGIAINNGGVITYHKDIGLVSDVFNQSVVDKLEAGKMAVRTCSLFNNRSTKKRKCTTNCNKICKRKLSSSS